ncbi:hypothetical protein GYMLUDRAFT_244067 [Collybiopsis luxurians FD-317 M1]|uniref:Uncharacterized protein n=1 Tax=Collybiopsis luxurians FD-317 M1 TaxID=944289 RepID=A0A0D0BYM2_9AGAR|nr:hypothetical protein GYMLUDRAFT_244067 [Collybiopsis luxurians FD-317 M1]
MTTAVSAWVSSTLFRNLRSHHAPPARISMSAELFWPRATASLTSPRMFLHHISCPACREQRKQLTAESFLLHLAIQLLTSSPRNAYPPADSSLDPSKVGIIFDFSMIPATVTAEDQPRLKEYVPPTLFKHIERLKLPFVVIGKVPLNSEA